MRQKPKTAAQLLNIYINSGGTKYSYDEVVAACRREKIEKKFKSGRIGFINIYLLKSKKQDLTTLFN